MTAEIAKPPEVSMLELNSSNLCNLKCLTCVRNAKDYIQPRAAFMGIEEFKTIMGRFNSLPKLQICGFSEPTLNSALPEMVALAKEQGVKHVETFTNGTRLNGAMADRLAHSGLDLLRVSIDGGNPDTYRRVRGFKLEQVVANVRTFADKSNIPVRMETVLSKHTIESAATLPNVAEAVGARCLSVRLLDGQDSRLSEDHIYDPDCLSKLKTDLQESCAEKGIELAMTLPGENVLNLTGCTAWKEVYVNETGGLLPCYLLGIKPVGNLLEKTFDEIWASQSEVFNEQRKGDGGFLESCCCNYALVAQNKVG